MAAKIYFLLCCARALFLIQGSVGSPILNDLSPSIFPTKPKMDVPKVVGQAGEVVHNIGTSIKNIFRGGGSTKTLPTSNAGTMMSSLNGHGSGVSFTKTVQVQSTKTSSHFSSSSGSSFSSKGSSSNGRQVGRKNQTLIVSSSSLSKIKFPEDDVTDEGSLTISVKNETTVQADHLSRPEIRIIGDEDNNTLHDSFIVTGSSAQELQKELETMSLKNTTTGLPSSQNFINGADNITRNGAEISSTPVPLTTTVPYTSTTGKGSKIEATVSSPKNVEEIAWDQENYEVSKTEKINQSEQLDRLRLQATTTTSSTPPTTPKLESYTLKIITTMDNVSREESSGKVEQSSGVHEKENFLPVSESIGKGDLTVLQEKEALQTICSCPAPNIVATEPMSTEKDVYLAPPPPVPEKIIIADLKGSQSTTTTTSIVTLCEEVSREYLKRESDVINEVNKILVWLVIIFLMCLVILLLSLYWLYQFCNPVNRVLIRRKDNICKRCANSQENEYVDLRGVEKLGVKKQETVMIQNDFNKILEESSVNSTIGKVGGGDVNEANLKNLNKSSINNFNLCQCRSNETTEMKVSTSNSDLGNASTSGLEVSKLDDNTGESKQDSTGFSSSQSTAVLDSHHFTDSSESSDKIDQELDASLGAEYQMECLNPERVVKNAKFHTPIIVNETVQRRDTVSRLKNEFLSLEGTEHNVPSREETNSKLKYQTRSFVDTYNRLEKRLELERSKLLSGTRSVVKTSQTIKREGGGQGESGLVLYVNQNEGWFKLGESRDGGEAPFVNVTKVQRIVEVEKI